MGIFDRLLGRKKDDLGLGNDELALDKPSYKPLSDDELGLPELEKRSSLPKLPDDEPEAEEPGVSPLHNYQPGALRQRIGSPQLQARDVELILSKLDTIRSILTNLDIRISNLEQAAGVNEKEKKRYQW